MSNTFYIHVNNHVNRKPYDRMTSGEKKKTQPSYTVAGVLEGDILKFGISVCSKEDSFSKETGRNRALANVREESRVTIPKYVVENGGLGRYFVTKAKRLIKNTTHGKHQNTKGTSED